MGFLIEIYGETPGAEPSSLRRELISEEDLLKTHSKEMYQYLKSTLRYEIKVPVKKSELMSPDFDQFLENINKGGTGHNIGSQQIQMHSDNSSIHKVERKKSKDSGK